MLNGFKMRPLAGLMLSSLLFVQAPMTFAEQQSADYSVLETRPSYDKNRPVTLSFQDIAIRNVLQVVAEMNGLNLVVSDSVDGNITLKLEGVKWSQALDIILKSKGLDKRLHGNVLLIAPKAELDEQDRLTLEHERQQRELASLRSEVIQINYANAAEVAELLKEDERGVTLLTPRGNVSVDNRTNTLLIKDLSDNIDVIKSLINTIDIPVSQVEIEARIVTVDEGMLDELGVRWGTLKQNANSSQIGGTLDFNAGTSGVDINKMMNVNLGAVSGSASSIAFQVANLGNQLLLDLELSALELESKAEIISSPRLLATNKKPAFIEQGVELPYVVSSEGEGVEVAFKKAVLSLYVLPQITPDDKLVLDLTVTQDKPAAAVKAGAGEAMAINTQRINTQVLAQNGETIVLGGIYQQSIEKSVEKVPLLGDVPLLGHLFRRDYENIGKRELLIFVTPRIMKQ
ncbi:type IV pilus secretin PilQ [Veronia nyctiphanis]|uniref:Type IV pilus secretin PilQ n=1 Tax=Veronia nyctiphanis TaxID=1278244 RepID=A0A4Q0YS26_9GAMM|nr:type IV pilus secretin PilQ [Veronia nyctiphanis]RXJ73453.1 type IV pilus secretin PilQ [Veronia nyctiphanis]